MSFLLLIPFFITGAHSQTVVIPVQGKPISVHYDRQSDRFQMEWATAISSQIQFTDPTSVSKSYCDFLKQNAVRATQASALKQFKGMAREDDPVPVRFSLLPIDWRDPAIQSQMTQALAQAGFRFSPNRLVETHADLVIDVEVQLQKTAMTSVLGVGDVSRDIRRQIANSSRLDTVELDINARDLACDIANKQASIVVSVHLQSDNFTSVPMFSVSQILSVVESAQSIYKNDVSQVPGLFSPDREGRKALAVAALVKALSEKLNASVQSMGPKNFIKIADRCIDSSSGELSGLSYSDAQSLISEITTVASHKNEKVIQITVQ